MSDITTAVIQFVGLLVFSTELSNEPGLFQALMPRVPVIKREVTTRRDKWREAEGNAAHPVEKHVGILAYRVRDRIAVQGWTEQKLVPMKDDDYVYILLQGERITFEPASKSRVVRRTERRIDPQRPAPSGLALPHLAECCGKQAAMKADYREVTKYRGAAAVFDLRVGEVSACGAYADDVLPSRMDTRLAIPNQGKLVVRTLDGTKRLELEGWSTLLAANIPEADVTGKPSEGFGAHHYTAYYDMVDQTAACMKEFGCARDTTTSRANRCLDKSIIREGFSAQDLPTQFVDFTSMLRVDFQCSNSQYP